VLPNVATMLGLHSSTSRMVLPITRLRISGLVKLTNPGCDAEYSVFTDTLISPWETETEEI